MEIPSILIQTGIILTPGLITIGLLSYMTQFGKLEKFDKIFLAIINSEIIFLIYTLIVNLLCIRNPLKVNFIGENYYIGNISPLNISLLLVISILYSLIFLWIFEKDIALIITNHLKITNKLSGNIWEKSLKEYKDKWVKIYVDKDSYIRGWLKYFSTGDEKNSVLLADPKWFKWNENEGIFEENYKVERQDKSYYNGLLLLDNIRCIEIIEMEKDPDYEEKGDEESNCEEKSGKEESC